MTFNEKLTGSLEDNILTMLVWDVNNCATVAMRVDIQLFSTRAYQKIAALAVEYMEKYNKPPRAHMRDLLEAELRRGEEGRFLAQILDAMEQMAPELQSEYVLQELARFVRIRHMTLAVRRAEDHLHVGDLEEAEAALSEAHFEEVEDTPGVWLHDTANWLSFLDRDEEDETFSSGIAVLDERAVRPRRRSVFLVIAPAGRGKSYWLRQIARDNVMGHHKKVLFLSLENDLEDTQQAFTMGFLGETSEHHSSRTVNIPTFERDADGRSVGGTKYAHYTLESLKPERRHEIAKALKPFQKHGKLHVKWFPSGTLTVARLNSYLDYLERTYNFRPDMLVIDYPDLMATDDKNLRISLGRLFVAIRGIAGQRGDFGPDGKRKGMAVVAATQSNRLSADAKVVTAKMVAEDWSKIGTADTVCVYTQTKQEHDLGIARVLVDKSRRSRDKWVAFITQSYETGQFCVDSVFMTKLVQEELGRLAGPEDDD